MCFKVLFLIVSMVASHLLASKAACVPNSHQPNIADAASDGSDGYDMIEKSSLPQEASTSEDAQKRMSRSQVFVKSFTELLKKAVNPGPSAQASLARESNKINDEMNKLGSSQNAQKDGMDSDVDMAVATLIQQENIPDEAVPQSMISSAATSSVIQEVDLALQKFKYNITANVHEQIGATYKVENTFNVKLEHKAGRTKQQQLSRLSDGRISRCMENAKKNLYAVGVKEWQIKEKIVESLESTLSTGLPSDVQKHENAIRQYLEKIRDQASTERNTWLDIIHQSIDVAAEYLAWQELFQEQNIIHPELRDVFEERTRQGCSHNFYYKDTHFTNHAYLILKECREVIGSLKKQGDRYGLKVKKSHIIQSLHNIQKEHTQRFEREQANLRDTSSGIVELGAERASVMGFCTSTNGLFEDNLKNALMEAKAQQDEENKQEKQLSEFREKAEVSTAAKVKAEAEKIEALRVAKADKEAKVKAQRDAVEAQELAARSRAEAADSERAAKNAKMNRAGDHYKLIINLHAKCSALYRLYEYNGMDGFFSELEVNSCDDIIRQGSNPEVEQSFILADKLVGQLNSKERTLLAEKPVHPWMQLIFELEVLGILEHRLDRLARLPNQDNQEHLSLFIRMINVIGKATYDTLQANKDTYFAMHLKQVCLMVRHRLTKYCIQNELYNSERNGQPEGFRLELLCNNPDIKCLDGDYEWFDYLPSGYISEENIDRAMMKINSWDVTLKRPMNYTALLTRSDLVEESIWDTVCDSGGFKNPLFVGVNHRIMHDRMARFYEESDMDSFFAGVRGIKDEYRNNRQSFLNNKLGFPENGTNYWLYPDPIKDHLNVHSVKLTSSALKRMLVTTTQVLAFDLLMQRHYVTPADKAKTAYYRYGSIEQFKEKFISNTYKKGLIQDEREEERRGPEFKYSDILDDSDSLKETIVLLEKHNTFEEMQEAIAAVLQEQDSEDARKMLLEEFWVTEAEGLRVAQNSLNAFMSEQLEQLRQSSQNEIDIRAFELLNRDLIAFLNSREDIINNHLRSLRRPFSVEDALVIDILVATEYWSKLPSDLVDIPLNDREERALDYYTKEYLKSRQSSSAPVAGTTSYIDVDSKGNRERFTMHVSPTVQLSTSSVTSGSCSNDRGWFCKRNLIIAGVAVCVIGAGICWIGPAAACEGTAAACKGLFSWFTKKAAAKAVETGAELVAEKMLTTAAAAAL